MDLGKSASLKLVRWLFAILSPQPGRTAEDKGFSLWAAFCSGHVRFVVATLNGPAGCPVANESVPDSAEATELLIQFCAVYGLLELQQPPDDRGPELSPATADFLVAPALPCYRLGGLQP